MHSRKHLVFTTVKQSNRADEISKFHYSTDVRGTVVEELSCELKRRVPLTCKNRKSGAAKP